MSSRKCALNQKARAKIFRPIPLSSRAGHKSPHMKRPRLNRTENNKEDTAEECEFMVNSLSEQNVSQVRSLSAFVRCY